MAAEMIPDSIAQKCRRCGKHLQGDTYRVDRGEFLFRDGRGSMQKGAIAHFLEEFQLNERIGYFCEHCFGEMLNKE